MTKQMEKQGIRYLSLDGEWRYLVAPSSEVAKSILKNKRERAVRAFLCDLSQAEAYVNGGQKNAKKNS